MNHCVVTTINKPTPAIEKLYEHFGSNLIIVGDQKTPADWNYKNILPLTVSDKRYAPSNHYAQKNLGYLHAIKNKATLIYDTDDDNIPNDNWRIRKHEVEAFESTGQGWYNAYRLFTSKFIWPRGFSLKHLFNHPFFGVKKFKGSSIQQGLSDGEPDVDAIWRLTEGSPHYFQTARSVYLQPKTWCPVNSQSSWWFPKAFPLMYLPVNCSFRMTDIWRGFIAQRCLWEMGEGVTFHSPAEVFQDRNEHDLLKDFADEVPGYLNNDTIVEALGDLKLQPGEGAVGENLIKCYITLVSRGILPKEEMLSVTDWVKDYYDII